MSWQARTSDVLRAFLVEVLVRPWCGGRRRVPRARVTEDGIETLPVATFLRRLWAGEIATA